MNLSRLMRSVFKTTRRPGAPFYAVAVPLAVVASIANARATVTVQDYGLEYGILFFFVLLVVLGVATLVGLPMKVAMALSVPGVLLGDAVDASEGDYFSTATGWLSALGYSALNVGLMVIAALVGFAIHTAVANSSKNTHVHFIRTDQAH